MVDFFKKIIFLCKRPCIVLIIGKGSGYALENVLNILKNRFKVKVITESFLPWVKDKNEILIFQEESIDSEKIKNLSFLIKKSRLPILTATRLGAPFEDKILFKGDEKEAFQTRKIAKVLPGKGFLILNFDDEAVKEIKSEIIARYLSYGFQERADFRPADINRNPEGTNFKINYQGNTVPFWLEGVSDKEHIYGALAGICVGILKDLNLVEISQALKKCDDLRGRHING